MRLRLPPKQAFPHTITYKVYGEADDWGESSDEKIIELEYTRFDESYDFKRNGNNSVENMPNSLVTIFRKYNAEMPEFETNSTVVFKGKDFVIVSVIPLYFMSNEIIGYELEVK